MNRAIVGLAMRSGIPPDAWREMDPRDLDTALDLVHEETVAAEEATRRR
jgi:hypothetical protein